MAKHGRFGRNETVEREKLCKQKSIRIRFWLIQFKFIFFIDSRKSSKIYPKLPPRKSLFVAYTLWLFGGFFGLHYLYLGRDREAFLWWSTFGGYFGIGWMTDFFRLPKIVRDVNEDPAFIEQFVETLRKNPKPEFSTTRFLFGVMGGYLYAQLLQLAVPQERLLGVDWSYIHWFIPLAGSLGKQLMNSTSEHLSNQTRITAVWLVGNLGREKGVLWHCLLASYLTYPVRYVIYDDTYWMTGMMVVCAFTFDHFSKEWRREPAKKYSMKRRFAVLSAAVCVYLMIWAAYFYFNGKITDADGDEVPLREAVYNVLNSPWWKELKQTLSDTYLFAKHHGWYETYRQIINSLDVDGEKNAFQVNSSEEIVRRQSFD